MSDDNFNPAAKALDEMKKSVDQAMSRTEDVMGRMGYDISAASRVADDYRTKVFEYMRINMNAALDYANNLASVKWPTDLMGMTLGKVQDQGLTAPALTEMSAAAKAAEDYRARMFQFMKTNLNTMLEYAEHLATVKTPTEFIEVSTTHARKQFDTIAEQTNELREIAQKLSTWNK
jgi:hypothetical protein